MRDIIFVSVLIVSVLYMYEGSAGREPHCKLICSDRSTCKFNTTHHLNLLYLHTVSHKRPGGILEELTANPSQIIKINQYLVPTFKGYCPISSKLPIG